MEAQPPAQPRGRLGEDANWGAFVFIFCSSSPTPTRTQTETHTDTHRSSSKLGVFPALARGATRALFMAVDDAAV